MRRDGYPRWKVQHYMPYISHGNADECSLCLDPLNRNATTYVEGLQQTKPRFRISASRLSSRMVIAASLPLSQQQTCAQTFCGHWFHSACLRDSLQQRSSCPLCRQEISTYPGPDERTIMFLL